MPALTTTRVVVPRTGTLELDRDGATGALLAIRGGGRTYLTVDADGARHWHGVCTTREHRRPDGMTREVRTGDGGWQESYRWRDGLLTEVDGVEIRRDGSGRVVACLPGGKDPAPADHRWFYTHDEHGLTHVTAPSGPRSIGLARDGRVQSWTAGGVRMECQHDARGHRHTPARPLHDHVDDAGRCWATLDADGAPRHVYLWDGTRCLARIDGPVGAPLAAVFSLDPSATPVRVVTRDGAVRVPRDAYGEGLLDCPGGVPGLFGGQVHAGLVHLPLRRLDPRTGSFCDPDPCAGQDDDPRRGGGFEGPLPAEPDPCSAYDVCRGDPVGRADPSGGVSAGLVISDLTWSLQNNILSFFGIDWWFNLFTSLVVAPFKNAPSSPFAYDFFSSTGLTSSDRLGAFGVRRGGIVNAITDGRAFTTQHIVWSPDSAYAELEHGEVVDPGGELELTHYGTIVSLTPDGRPRTLLQSMALGPAAWATSSRGSLPSWSRHGGRGTPVAPGTLTPRFPRGGLHLDAPLTESRGNRGCTLTELAPAAVAVGDLEDRTFLTAAAPTGLGAGDRVLVEDGSTLRIASVVATVPAGPGQRVQLDADLDTMAATGLALTELSTTPLSSEAHGAGAVADSLDVHGCTSTYAVGDLLRVTAAGAEVSVARLARLEARVPLERPLPAGLAGPVTVTRGVVAAASSRVTAAGSGLDFGAAPRPAVGSTGLVSGGGVQVAVRVEAHTGTSGVTVDAALPAAVTGAPRTRFRAVNAGTLIGSRTDGAETDPVLTYTPSVAGTAPDGSTGTVVLRCDAGGAGHARVVTGAPAHDVSVLDRAVTGAAPFTTERYAATGAAVPTLTRSDVTGLVVPDPARFADAPAVFLTRVGGDPPTASTTLATGDVRAGVLTLTPRPAPAAGLQPGAPVLVGSRLAVVRTVRVTATFTGPYDLAVGGLRVVGLEPADGHAYLGEVTAAAEVLVLPSVSVGGADVDAPFPRFAVGDLVRVAPRTGGVPSWHRVTSASGGRLGLADGPALTAGDLVRVSHVATTDPGTGGPFLGVDGTRAGTGPTSTATFSVWSTGALSTPAGGTPLPVGIVDGDVTHPTTVTATAQPVEVTFSEPFDATGVTVSLVSRLADRFVPTLARDGGVLLLEGAAGDLVTGPGESVVAVAYTPVGTPATGTIGPGTLLVPEGEDTEVDRSQSLTDHELTHTLQYAKWGPLWFNLFPMLAMELPGILNTDTELPEFSRFVEGTLVAGTGNHWDLTVVDTGGVPIAVGDELQVVQGSRRAVVQVTAVTGAVLTTRSTGGTPPVGRVSARKRQHSTWFERFFSFFDLLTHGGLVNVLAGTTWGGIFWLLGKAFYGLGRAIGGTGELYPATVQAGGGALTLTSEADVTHILAEGRVVVRQGDDTVVRSMTRAGTVLTLDSGVAFTGDVQVAMYDVHDPGSAFDWYDYFPATVEADNAFTIEVGQADGRSLDLAPEDRVTISYRGGSRNTDVLSVSGSTVELLDPVPVVDGERSLRVAKIGASDPLGNWDSAVMVEMGMGWMKWVFDPYGQIERTVDVQDEWARWLLRVMRWLLGSQSFSLLPGGYLWWRRLIPLFVGPEHVTPIEQEASEESGDLYTPLGRVFGQRTDTGFARHRMVVGDVARYRYWAGDRLRTFVRTNRLDRPGTSYTSSDLRTLPNRDPVGDGSGGPDIPVAVGPAADPGTYVAEPFTVRDPDPRVVPSGDPLGFETSVLGSVPVGPRTERMVSGYVAFTRAGDHRLTTDTVGGIDEAVEASNRERQKLFFDVTATDVTVTVAGHTVDLTSPGTSDVVTMVPFQRAEVTVAPDASRAYQVAVPDPTAGAVRTDGNLRLVGASVSGALVPVEVSRFYPVAGGGYGPGGLAFAGMHLSRDVHVPVRRFSVEVVDTLPLRATADPAGAVVTSLAVGGEAFLLVPAPVTRPPTVTSVAGVPPAAGTPSPVTRVDAPDAAAYLGASGTAFRISFPAGSATGEVLVTVTVGVGTDTADLGTRFTLA